MDTTSKKMIYKKWWFWVGAIVLVGVIIQLTASKETKQKWAKEESQKAAQKTVDSIKWERNSWLPAECVYLPIGKDSARVRYNGASTSSTLSLVSNHFNKAIQFGRKAFKGDSSLKVIVFYTETGLKDANGNLDTSLVLAHRFLRDNFMRIKWENFEHENVAPQIARVAEQIYIHPAIRRGMNEENGADAALILE